MNFFSRLRLLRGGRADSAPAAQANPAVDAALAMLNKVAVPEGLANRVHARIALERSGVSGLATDQASDAAVTAALAALGRVPEPVYLKQRLSARLAREPISSADASAVHGWMPWAALGSIAAGLVVAVGSHLHTAVPAAPVAGTHASATAHPAFVPQQRTGRGAALNTNGVVATARARTANSMEEAENRRTGQHSKSREARLNAPAADPGANPHVGANAAVASPASR